MRTYKTEPKKVVDKIYCDACGEDCSKSIDHEYAELIATWGYCSKQDGMQYNIQICETCFNEVLQLIQRIRSFKRQELFSIMTFEEFVAEVDSVFNGFSYKNQLRYGQCLMNILYQSRPDLYKTIKGTDFDCFYDNSTVSFTLNHLETTWKNV